MITKYEFGSHFNTEAVVVPVEEGEKLPFLEVEIRGTERVFSGALAPEDRIYGLGETVGGINKRGQYFISYNVDNPHHKADTVSLYGAHKFLVIDGQKKLGLFFDTPGRVIFDLGKRDPSRLEISCAQNVTVYCVTGESAYDVTRQFLRIIGRSYVPPRWAFGFGQSRWGYKSEKDIRQVVEEYRKAELPLDYVCLDIDYMDRFIDFTVNPKRFPDMPGLIQELKAQGIRLVPIVDAGIKIEPGSRAYEEGIRGDYFCVDGEGKPFRGAVWPGMTHFPDFLRPETRSWFGGLYRFYTDQGFEGFWNDMNEPAIFFTEETKLRRDIDVLPGEDGNYQKGVRLCDYKSFYHRPDGEKVLHHDVHNVFGYEMTRAAGEGLEKLMDHRYLLFSRSSYIGAHRYGGIWTGDNASRWEHLRISLRQMPSLNMCGFLFIGSDIGGFGGNTDQELLLRWLAFGVFTPLMRKHSAKLTRRQECYRFPNREAFRRILRLRYRLLPYLYSEYMKAALYGDMLFKPLSFLYPGDPQAARVEDQLIVGGSIMIAPIMEKGQTTRQVYLPQDMTRVTYTGGEFRCEWVKAGTHTVKAELDEVVFFILPGKLLPIGKGIDHESQLDTENLMLLGDGERYALYDDDGLTREMSGNFIRILKRQAPDTAQ